MEAPRGELPIDPILEEEFLLWRTALANHGHILPDGLPVADETSLPPEQVPVPTPPVIDQIDPPPANDDQSGRCRRWPATIFVAALVLAILVAGYWDLGVLRTTTDLAATLRVAASPSMRTPPSDRAAPLDEADRRKAELADNIAHAGEVLAISGDMAGALRFYRQSLSIRRELAVRHPGDATAQRALAGGLDKVADAFAAQGDTSHALEAYREVEAAWEHCAQILPWDRDVQRNRSLTALSLGNLLLARNDPAEAVEAFRRGIALQEILCLLEPDNVAWQEDLALVWLRLSDAFAQKRDNEAALQACRNALTIDEALVTRDATNLAWQGDLATAHGKAGDLLLARNETDAALQEYHAAASGWEKLAATESNSERRRAVAEINDRIGQTLEAKKQPAAALPYYQGALRAIADPKTENPTNQSLESLLASIYFHLGRATADCQPPDRQAARVALREACNKLNNLKSLDGTYPSDDQVEMLARVEQLLAELDQ